MNKNVQKIKIEKPEEVTTNTNKAN
jgi:hypothetical protein